MCTSCVITRSSNDCHSSFFIEDAIFALLVAALSRPLTPRLHHPGGQALVDVLPAHWFASLIRSSRVFLCAALFIPHPALTTSVDKLSPWSHLFTHSGFLLSSLLLHRARHKVPINRFLYLMPNPLVGIIARPSCFTALFPFLWLHHHRRSVRVDSWRRLGIVPFVTAPARPAGYASTASRFA